MGNLHKKIITDKNGKRTTVWVKDDEGYTSKVKKISKPQEKPKQSLSDLSQELYEKVRRKEAGKGGELKLSIKETKELLDKGQIGVVSAGKNPNDPKESNLKGDDELFKKRDKKLKADLVKKGFMFVPVVGKYGDIEDSYMVMIPDIKKDELNKLGTKYNQDSVIFTDKKKNEVMYTTGEHKGTRNVGEGYKTLKKEAADFYTKVEASEGTFKYSFNINWDDFIKGLLSIFYH